jgi:hypothetical protein
MICGLLAAFLFCGGNSVVCPELCPPHRVWAQICLSRKTSEGSLDGARLWVDIAARL